MLETHVYKGGCLMEENENQELEKIEEIPVEGNDTIKIANEAVATYAGIAISEVPGVYGMAGSFAGGITEALRGKKNLAKGIKVDVLVSNPPYIPKDEKMEKSVVDFEPHVALFGGDDGLYFYRKIFANAHQIIKEKAILAFEMGYNQKESMEAEAKKYFPNDRMETIKDLNGKNRMFW